MKISSIFVAFLENTNFTWVSPSVTWSTVYSVCWSHFVLFSCHLLYSKAPGLLELTFQFSVDALILYISYESIRHVCTCTKCWCQSLNNVLCLKKQTKPNSVLILYFVRFFMHQTLPNEISYDRSYHLFRMRFLKASIGSKFLTV